jgi:hypothetical protein
VATPGQLGADEFDALVVDPKSPDVMIQRVKHCRGDDAGLSERAT